MHPDTHTTHKQSVYVCAYVTTCMSTCLSLCVCLCVSVCVHAYVYVHTCARTNLTGRSAPAVVTRVSIHTSSVVETVAGGCVAAFGTSAGEDARVLAGRRTGESTPGTCRTESTELMFTHPRVLEVAAANYVSASQVHSEV